MTDPATRHHLRRIEFLLWTLGALCAGYVVMVAVQARSARAASLAMVAATPAAASFTLPSAKDAARVMGTLAIPDLDLSVPVMADFDTDSLLRGVGHIRGTAMPGGLGTMGLAGHRDTYFRPLRRIRLGMRIDVRDETGTYHYQVDSTQVVTPEEVQVLNIQDRPEMTLITCYPFDFVGAAPKRFIVHAHLLSASPDAVTRGLR